MDKILHATSREGRKYLKIIHLNRFKIVMTSKRIKPLMSSLFFQGVRNYISVTFLGSFFVVLQLTGYVKRLFMPFML